MSDSLFALSKISGPGGTSPVQLSDAELSRVEGGASVTPLSVLSPDSVFQLVANNLISQSNVAEQSNSSSVSQDGGNSTTVSQDNSRTQTNSGTSGSNQSTQSNGTISTQGNGASGSGATVTIATEGKSTVVTVTDAGSSVTVVLPQSVSQQALLNALPVQTLASVDMRILQAVLNVSAPTGGSPPPLGLRNR
jgi:hypothetical protein